MTARNLFHIALTVLCFGFIAAVTLADTQGAAKARAIDGDTIEIDGTRYRLLGYDTPEIHHAKCASERLQGQHAKAIMQNWLATSHWRLERIGRRDRYGRVLARMFYEDIDVAERFIAAGLARPYWGGRRAPWCRP